jgi:hypothetical protein
MGKPGKYFRMIKDPEKRDRGWDFYVHWKSIYSLGESEVGFFRSAFGFQSLAVFYLVGDNILTKLGIDIPVTALPWLIPILFTLKILLYVGIGLLWDRKKMVNRQIRWSNKRNELLQKISEATNAK